MVGWARRLVSVPFVVGQRMTFYPRARRADLSRGLCLGSARMAASRAPLLNVSEVGFGEAHEVAFADLDFIADLEPLDRLPGWAFGG